jgi:catechol-2,3-dioxygenase
LYWDRPKNEWPIKNGKLEMYSEVLDLDELLREK